MEGRWRRMWRRRCGRGGASGVMLEAVAVMVVVGGCVVAVEVAAEVAEAQTFSSLLPSFMFIVGVAGSWCRLLVTEWAGMSD